MTHEYDGVDSADELRRSSCRHSAADGREAGRRGRAATLPHVCSPVAPALTRSAAAAPHHHGHRRNSTD